MTPTFSPAAPESQSIIQVSALVTAIIGGLVVLFGQRYMHAVTTKTDRKKLRREHLEKIVYMLHEYTDWLTHDSLDTSHGRDGSTRDIYSLIKIRASIDLYFPFFLDMLLPIYLPTAKYAEFKSEFHAKLAEHGVSGNYEHWDNERFLEHIFRPHVAAKDALVAECRAVIEADEAPILHRWLFWRREA